MIVFVEDMVLIVTFGRQMRNLTRHLYFWVLLAIVLGGTIGYVSPETGVKLKPLGDGFIALVKMLISPIIFCTVVLGIAGAGSMKKVGRVGGKALLYFEIVSTFALMIGLLIANLIRPGAGFNADPATLDAKAVADYAKVASTQTTTDFILHIIPQTFFNAFTGSGDLLQVLFVAVLFGYAMTHLGKEGDIVHQVITTSSHVIGTPERRAGRLKPEPVRIGHGAWIASRAVILPGVEVGEGAIVAAGAVVARSVAPNTLVGGIPARVIRHLDH